LEVAAIIECPSGATSAFSRYRALLAGSKVSPLRSLNDHLPLPRTSNGLTPFFRAPFFLARRERIELGQVVANIEGRS